jgi:hypothetical protein
VFGRSDFDETSSDIAILKKLLAAKTVHWLRASLAPVLKSKAGLDVFEIL